MAKSNRLTLFLLRPEVINPQDAIRATGLTEHDLNAALGVPGRVYVKTHQNPTGPSWLNYLQPASADPLGNILSASSGAVLFLQTSGRWFVFAFGYGRALLDLDLVEPRFGLKVTINLVDADELKSIDTKTYEGAKFQIRRQAAGKTSLDSFGLDIRKDILSAVQGIPPKDFKLASSLAGRDSLSVSTDQTALQLPGLCNGMLTAFNADKYKERFGWIDQLKPVSDSKTVSDLDTKLIALLNASDLELIDLGMPEVIDPERISGFRYPHTPGTELESELDIAEFVDASERKGSFTLDYLKNNRIAFYYESDSSASGSWSIYKCLVAQIDEPGNKRSFVLTTGEWFEVANDLVAEVNSYLSTSLPFCEIPFPELAVSMDEGEYNELAAQALPDTILQDRCLIAVGGPYGQVEPCDLLTKDRKIIHVKRKTRSATLSHLYAQAEVSAELLRRDAKFVKAWKSQVKKANTTFNTVIQDKFSRDLYEVVLVILTPKPENIPLKLPFFARLQLRQVAERLQDAGYKVSVAGVPECVVKVAKAKATRKPKAP